MARRSRKGRTYADALWDQGAPKREAERRRLLTEEVPNPRRITLALDSRDLYGPEVDRACGGEEPMVDEWETGERIPTAEQMVKLADLTGYPIRFFYGEDPPVSRGFICIRSGPGRGCHAFGEAAS